MVDFNLSDIQREIQRTARDFAQKEVAPKAAHHDQTMEFPRELLKKAWELGLINVTNPEAAGGLGLGTFESALISEEMGAACTGVGTAMDANTLAAAPVIVGGTPEQHKRILGPMAEEFTLCAYCVTEPGAGSDVAGLKTTAVRKGDSYVINGSKMWITNAGYADWFFVLAYTDASKKHHGMSAFVVPAGTPGLQVGKKEINVGQRCSDTRAVMFDDVVIHEDNRIGDEGAGWRIAMTAFDKTRPKIGAMATGLARCAMTHAIAYAKERKTFGKPIASHQAIQFMIADMARDIEAARLLVWQAAWRIDNGLRNTREAAIAKLFASDMAMRVAVDAVQVFGGYGFNTEYPVEKLMRDAKIFQIYEGTSQIQRLIIARETFR
jgi:acyl-CoA dehydrogenase